MIAYNKDWLDHLLIREKAEDAFQENNIPGKERDALNAKYPVGFYMPNIFVRMGLFLLTFIILLFSFGLLVLIFLGVIENTIGGLAIFFALISYAALEYMIRVKKHFRSGVDDGLLWGASIALFCGIALPHEFSNLVNCMIIFILSLYGSLRYADRLMAAIAFLSVLGILFYTCIEFGTTAKTMAPFIIMAASLVTYFATKKIQQQKSSIHYSGNLIMIEMVSLIAFYVAGNYYIVRELSNSMFALNLQPGDSISLGWLFWIFTVSIPIIYIGAGIRKKDAILIRAGLILVATIVFTIRHYHSILPVETMMVMGGVVLLLVAYGLMKYLHKPKYGFTYQEISSKNQLGKLNIESLVLAQTFKPGSEDSGSGFGGGSFGGGGASGDY